MNLEDLKARQVGIGSSDAAAVIGVPTYNTALDVWRSKVTPIEEGDDEPEMGPTFWGNQLEEAIARAYARSHDIILRKPPLMRATSGAPMVASIDFVENTDHLPLGAPVPRALEVKTRDRGLAFQWGPSKAPGVPGVVPEDIWVQVQHQYMVVPMVLRIDVAVLIGGNDYREYEIKRDDGFITDLRAAELAWWDQFVLTKIPPPATHADIATLKRVYPGTDGSEVDLAALAAWHQTRLDAKKRVAELMASIELSDALILEAMKNASIGRLPVGMGRYERKEVKRAGYVVADTKYVELRHVKAVSK